MPSMTVMAPTARLALADREPGGAAQELRHPGGDAAHGEGERGQAEGGGEKGGVAEEAEDGGAIGGRAGCGRWRRAPVRCPASRRGRQ